MKRLLTHLHRLTLFVLSLIPACALVFEALFNSYAFGLMWFTGLSLLAAITAFVPPTIGNYSVRTVTVFEGNATNDPNPDRETRQEIIKEGRRFYLRLTVDIILLIANIIAILLLPIDKFIDASIARRLVFAAVSTFLFMVALRDISSYDCFWTDTPGVLVGAIVYLIAAIVLKFSPHSGGFNALITVCAVAFLFFGTIALNSRSIAESMSSYTDKLRKPPKPIGRRNRRIVITFACTVTVAALIGAVRNGILWVLARIGDFLKFISLLLRGGSGSEVPPDLPAGLMPQATVMQAAPQVVETVEETSLFTDLVVYLFFGVVGIGLICIIYSAIKKLSDKLTKWFERFARGVNEGYYDERERIMSAEEAGDRIRSRLRERLKTLMKRDTPWEKLSGRERARRLFKAFRKKRIKSVNGAKSLTAREFIEAADCHKADRNDFASAYDAARYSENEVSADEMDKLKKDLNI